jgi:hypothetical protein
LEGWTLLPRAPWSGLFWEDLGPALHAGHNRRAGSE